MIHQCFYNKSWDLARLWSQFLSNLLLEKDLGYVIYICPIDQALGVQQGCILSNENRPGKAPIRLGFR